MSVKFDPTFNVGHLLTIATLAIGGVVTFGSIQGVLGTQEVRLKSLESTVIAVGNIATAVASDQVRISNLEAVISQIGETSNKMLEKLSTISADVAVLKAVQASDVRPAAKR